MVTRSVREMLAGAALLAVALATPHSVAVAKSLPADIKMPVAHSGIATLVCNISSSANGSQKLVFEEGGGIEFYAEVGPLVDGVVNRRDAKEGATYSFTSHLVKPTKATLPGIGEVSLETLTTRASVAIDRYDMPDGARTFTFGPDDLSRRGAYVEFVGTARRGDETFEFSATLGSALSASGEIAPANENANSTLAWKAVTVRAPVTTLVRRR